MKEGVPLEFVTNPWFYLVAYPAILIVGFSKAGVGGGLGIMAVPMIALFVPPLQAAAVLMPLLLFMDIFTLRAYWGCSTAEIWRSCCPDRWPAWSSAGWSLGS